MLTTVYCSFGPIFPWSVAQVVDCCDCVLQKLLCQAVPTSFFLRLQHPMELQQYALSPAFSIGIYAIY